MISPRQRFLNYVRHIPGSAPIVSPFLPKPELLEKTLRYLHLPVTDDPVVNEIRLSHALDYEPMFMTDLGGLIFPAEPNVALPPITCKTDLQRLIDTCGHVGDREQAIHKYYRDWREKVGEEGVIVIGHPLITWLSNQVGQDTMIYIEADYPDMYKKCLEAIWQAAIYVFGIGMQEGIDFMSEGGYGLEMVSPRWYETYDLPYISRMAAWTHAQGGLFWQHNCGKTRELIRRGFINRLGVDVLETISPPPEGNNDLAESRRMLDPKICTKGNLSLILLRDSNVERIVETTRKMVRAVQGYSHIHATADAVFAETPVENFVAFLRTARQEAEALA